MSENEPITVSADNYFAAIPYWVLEAGLSSSAVHLYAVLLRFSNWTSKQGYPSRQRLATCMKVSIKTVDRAKDELLAAGVLIYERRHNKSNHYTVLTSRDKNDTTKGGRDKNDISRGDKNDTLTRVINNNKTPADKSATQKLVSLYMENLPLTSLKPSGKQIGGQIQQLLKTNTVEVLTLLIPIVAKDAKPLSTGTLMIAQTQLPNQTPTPTAPQFDREEFARTFTPEQDAKRQEIAKEVKRLAQEAKVRAKYAPESPTTASNTPPSVFTTKLEKNPPDGQVNPINEVSDLRINATYVTM